MPYDEKRITGGLNLGASPDAIGDGELSDAIGCAYPEDGAVSSEDGRDKIIDLLGSEAGEVLGFGEAVLNGRRYIFSKVGETIYRDEVPIATGWEDGGRLSVVSYNNYAYLYDGETAKRYSIANGLEEVGSSAPTAAMGAAKVDPTPLLGALLEGRYRYAYTFHNGVAESNFSPTTEVNVSAANVSAGVRAVDLTLIATGPAGTIERRVYRTSVNTEAYFLIHRITDNTTTEYQDLGGLPAEADQDAVETDKVRKEKRNIPDIARRTPARFPGIFPGGTAQAAQDDGLYRAEDYDLDVHMTNLGILADWTDHDPPPPGLRQIGIHRETVYGIAGNQLVFSRRSAPEYFPVWNRIPVGRQRGETLLAWKPMGESIICYTDSNIYRFTRLGFEARESRMEGTNSPVGLAAEGAVAIASTSGGRAAGHVFLAHDGLYLFDGQEVTRISRRIEALFSQDNRENFIDRKAQAKAVLETVGDKLFLSYSIDGGVSNTRTLSLDAHNPDDLKFSTSMLGYDWLHTSGDGRLLGGQAGSIYVVGRAGEDVLWSPRSRQFPLRGSTAMEAMERIKIDADLAGAVTEVTLETDIGISETYQIEGRGRQLYVRTLPNWLKGNRISVRLTSTSRARRTWYGAAFGYDEEEVGAA